jgi:hypothetical protein
MQHERKAAGTLAVIKQRTFRKGIRDSFILPTELLYYDKKSLHCCKLSA